MKLKISTLIFIFFSLIVSSFVRAETRVFEIKLRCKPQFEPPGKLNYYEYPGFIGVSYGLETMGIERGGVSNLQGPINESEKGSLYVYGGCSQSGKVSMMETNMLPNRKIRCASGQSLSVMTHAGCDCNYEYYYVALLSITIDEKERSPKEVENLFKRVIAKVKGIVPEDSVEVAAEVDGEQDWVIVDRPPLVDPRGYYVGTLQEDGWVLVSFVRMIGELFYNCPIL